MKDALIEQLTEARYDSERISEKEYRYRELSEGDKQFYRDKMAELMPLIVAFVRDWLDAEFGATEVDRWMDEMGTREVMAALREIEES